MSRETDVQKYAATLVDIAAIQHSWRDRMPKDDFAFMAEQLQELSLKAAYAAMLARQLAED